MPVTLDVPILRAQAEQIACDDEFAAARGGNRAGKSIGFGYWLFLKRLQKYPLAVHAVAGVDYENLRRGFFPLMVGVLDSLGWEEGTDFYYRASGAPTLFLPRLHKHAKLHSLSVTLLERLKGTSIQTLVLEEPQAWGTRDMSGKRQYEILITRLSHSQLTRKLYPDLIPQLRMSFNPPAEGSWLWELIEKQWKPLGFRCWQMSVRDNHLLIEKDRYVANLEANLDPRRHKSEIDGEWATAGGSVYYAFDRGIHGVAPDGLPAIDAVDMTKPLLWSHDFNVGLMCSVIAQPFTQPILADGFRFEIGKPPIEKYRIPIPGWQRRIIRVLGEIALPDAGTPNVVRAFLERWGDIAKKTGVILYGDVSGGSRSQTADSISSSRRVWVDIETRLRKAGIKVATQVGGRHPAAPRNNPGVKDRVHETNAQLQTGEVDPQYGVWGGYGCTINIDECPTLVLDFNEVKWDARGYDLEKRPGTLLTHMSDAFGYLCYRQRSLARDAELRRRSPGPKSIIGR